MKRMDGFPLVALAALSLSVGCGQNGPSASNSGERDPTLLELDEPQVATSVQGLLKGSGGTNGQGDYCGTALADNCSSGEGDCDRDDHCTGALVCGSDNGAQFGFSTVTDVCVPAHCTNSAQDAGNGETGVDCGGDCGTCIACPANGNPDTCSPECKCDAGEGDCDSDSQCNGALVCGSGLGAQFSMNSSFDVCVEAHCTNGTQDSDETGTDCGGADCGTCDFGSYAATSCDTDTYDCGPSDDETCCSNPPVSGGTFTRNYDNVTLADNSDRSAAVSNFHMNKYEVTVERFRKFIAAYDAWVGGGNPTAGAGANPNIAGSGWDASWSLPANANALSGNVTSCNATYRTYTGSSSSKDNKPMNCVNWYEAFAFCVWDGGRLATEAEWNYAASGGSDQRVYPWSSPATSTTLTAGTHAAYNCDNSGSGQTCAGTDIPYVGYNSAGQGLYGQYDLAGSMWEWTLDWWTETLPFPCSNCAPVTNQGYPWRVIKGGSWATFTSGNLLAGVRQKGNPDARYIHVGWRCVADTL